MKKASILLLALFIAGASLASEEVGVEAREGLELQIKRDVILKEESELPGMARSISDDYVVGQIQEPGFNVGYRYNIKTGETKILETSTTSNIYDVNKKGDAVGISGDFRSIMGVSLPIVWNRTGSIIPISEIDDVVYPMIDHDNQRLMGYRPFSISDSGVVYGSARVAAVGPLSSNEEFAWIWTEEEGVRILENLDESRIRASKAENGDGKDIILGQTLGYTGRMVGAIWEDLNEKPTLLTQYFGVRSTLSLFYLNKNLVGVGLVEGGEAIMDFRRASIEPLDNPSPYTAVLRDINSKKQVVGAINLDTYSSYPVVWDSRGTFHSLEGNPGLDGRVTTSSPMIRINDNGMVAMTTYAPEDASAYRNPKHILFKTEGLR